MTNRFTVLVVTATAAFSVGATGVAAKPAPQTGPYKATGKVAFKFTLVRARCPLAPNNLKNDKARRGAVGLGLCFRTIDVPTVRVVCSAGPTNTLYVALSPISGLRLTRNRTLHVKAYTYPANSTTPIGYTELSLTLKGTRGTGFVRTTEDDGPLGTCDTGKLTFTARRK